MQSTSMPFGNRSVEHTEQATRLSRPSPYYYTTTQPHKRQRRSSVRSITSNPRQTLPATLQTSSQQLAHTYRPQTPHSPPSPPEDDMAKPSLPSISSLLHIAGPERRAVNIGSPTHPITSQTGPYIAQQRSAITSHPYALTYEKHDSPQQTNAYPKPPISRVTLPPTPPMQPETLADSIQSPIALSSPASFVSSHSYYPDQSLSGPDFHFHRQAVPPTFTSGSSAASATSITKRRSLPSNHPSSPYGSTTYSDSLYCSSPGGASVRSSYSMDAPSNSSYDLHGQQPLPSTFPPAPPLMMMPLPTSAPPFSSSPASTSNTQSAYQQPQHYSHQHHHYISASSASPFPQSQDRYLCPTCNKAFSRPSSLRIHSHSHTGEKPFRCPHLGCGKAFSVRSNMKRHERGCHAAGNGAFPV